MTRRLRQTKRPNNDSSHVQVPGTETGPEETPAPVEAASGGPPSLELEQLKEAWQRTILPAVEEKSIPTASVLREAQPKDLAGDTLTVEFPRAASFHRQLAEEPKNATLLEEALYEITGRHLSLAFEVGGRARHLDERELERKARVAALAHVLDGDREQVAEPEHGRLAELVGLLT